MFNFKKKTGCDTPEFTSTVPMPPVQPPKEEEWAWVDGYKGTDQSMCCRGYQYELGKQFDMPDDEEISECKNGFHLSLYLHDVERYYSIGKCNRFFTVRALVRKSDLDRYGHGIFYEIDGYQHCTGQTYDKLVAKSIIFVSELSVEEILEHTLAADLPSEYQRFAIEKDPEYACRVYQIDTLVADGYSMPFSQHVVNDGKFNIAHAVGSQKDLSMDVKVLTILYNTR